MTDAKEAMDEEIRRCRACEGSTEILVRQLIRVLDNAGYAIVPVKPDAETLTRASKVLPWATHAEYYDRLVEESRVRV